MSVKYIQQNTRFRGQAFQENSEVLGIADYLWEEVLSSSVTALEKP